MITDLITSKMVLFKIILFTMIAGSLTTSAAATQAPTGEKLVEIYELPTKRAASDLPERFTARLVEDGTPEILVLRRHRVRTEDYRLLVRRENGAVIELDPPAPRTYSGYLAEDPGSRVIVALLPQGLRGLMERSDGSRLLLRPAASGSSAHRLIATTSPSFNDEILRLDSQKPESSSLTQTALSQAPTKGLSGPPWPFVSVQVAWEVDWAFQANRGHDLPTITADADIHTAEVDLVYSRDALTRHFLEALVLGADGDSLTLDDFRLRWEANHENIDRAAACLISEGLGSTGGLAWVGTIGGADFAYCTSWWVDTTVLVHELGHLWGDLHSDNWMIGHAMWGNWTPRWLGPSLHNDVLTRRDAIGSPATGPWPDPVEPFAMADVVDADYGQVVIVDVLADDHDANDEAPVIAEFDALSQWGGTVDLSVGTGPGGRDELRYTPSTLLPTNRNDSFWYRAGEAGIGGLESPATRVKVVPTPGPARVHWPLEGSGSDCTGFADASVAGSVAWAASPGGQALVFDGSDDLVTAAPLDLETDRLTIVAWLKKNGTQPDYSAIFSSRAEVGKIALNFGPNSGGGALGYHWEESNAWTWNSGLFVPDDQWVLAALVVEPDQATIYLHDGTLDSAVRTATHTPFRLAYRVPEGSWIGSYLGWTSRVISGEIDGVRVYTSALSAAQIDQLYQNRYLADLAECPTPQDGGEQVFFRPASLAWEGASSEYDLYLDQSWSAVRDATVASPEYVGRQAAKSYALATLEPTTLYWRVDPVEGGVPLASGDVWRLTGVNGLAGHWKLDEGSGGEAGDASGNEAHGTVAGAEWTTGIDGAGLLFSGNDSVTFGTKPALDGLVDFTLATWVRTTTTSRGVLMQQRNGGFNGEYMLQVQPSGVVSFFIYGGSQTQFDFTGSLPINDGAWHHVTAVREGGIGRIYIDGVLDTSADGGTARPLDASIGVALGADIRDNTAYYQGELDDVRIYDLALSDQEIADLYAQLFADGFESGDASAWGAQP